MTGECRPEVRGKRSGPIDRAMFGAGAWAYAARCYPHDTSWTGQDGFSWSGAMAWAEDHRAEFAGQAP